MNPFRDLLKSTPALFRSRKSVTALLLIIVCGFPFSAGADPAADATTNVSISDSPPTAGKRSSYVPTAQEMLTHYGPGTVLLTLKEFGVPLDKAAGFFATADGVLITHSTIIRQLLSNPNANLEITTYDKKTIKDWRLLSCGANQWGLAVGHLCALQTTFKPKVLFVTAPPTDLPTAPITASEMNIIGHPHSSEFLLTRLSVKSIKALSTGEEDSFVFNGMLDSGDRGGPVFDNDGHLIGVADRISNWRPITAESDEGVIPALIPSEALNELLRSGTEGMSLADARKLTSSQLAEQIHKYNVDDLEPALQFALQGKPLAGLKGFREVAFKFDRQTMLFNLPAIFGDCSFTDKTRESTLHACSALEGAALFSIRRIPNKGFEDLSAKNGQRLAEAKQVQAVEKLISEDSWDLFEPILTFQQKKALTSESSVSQCQAIRAGSVNGNLSLFSSASACRFTTVRDARPNGSSVSVWVAKDQFIYQMSIWMTDSRLADYFARVPSLAIMTAHWEKEVITQAAAPTAHSRQVASSELGVRPLPNYKIDLPEAVSFKGSHSDNRGRQVDLYGKKLLLDQFEDSFTVAVSAQSRNYLPPDFDDVTKKANQSAAALLGAKVQNKTVEMEAITLANEPARLITAFATDSKGRSALLMTAVIFYGDQTFEISEVTATKDPGDAFREFKLLLDGFKRK